MRVGDGQNEDTDLSRSRSWLRFGCIRDEREWAVGIDGDVVEVGLREGLVGRSDLAEEVWVFMGVGSVPVSHRDRVRNFPTMEKRRLESRLAAKNGRPTPRLWLRFRGEWREAELTATQGGEIGLGGAADEIDFEVIGGEIGRGLAGEEGGRLLG